MVGLNPCFNGRWTTTFYENRTSIHFSVSILVLLDNGLRLACSLVIVKKHKSLNPCFNGRWTTTFYENRTSIHFSVSILVLMDNGLRQY